MYTPRIRFLLLLLVLLPLHAQAADVATPDWYRVEAFEGAAAGSSDLKFGLGDDADRSVAIANAQRDIAAKIRTDLTSSLERETKVTDGLFGDKVKESATSSMKAAVSASLEDTVIVKEAHLGGRWYIAMRYDGGSLPGRIRRATASDNCPEGSGSDDLMQHSPLASKLNSLGGCHAALQLARRDGKQYVIVSGERTFTFREGESLEDWVFPELPYGDEGLAITTLPSVMTTGDAFHLEIRSRDDGYISLYNVYGDGLVTEIAGNLPIQAGKALHFPDEAFGREMVGVLAPPDRRSSSRELYIAVFKPVTFLLPGHQMAGSRIENSPTLHLLLEQVRQHRQRDGARYAVSALTIRPKL